MNKIIDSAKELREELLKDELDNINRNSNVGNSNKTSTSGINGIRPEIYELS